MDSIYILVYIPWVRGYTILFGQYRYNSHNSHKQMCVCVCVCVCLHVCVYVCVSQTHRQALP